MLNFFGCDIDTMTTIVWMHPREYTESIFFWNGRCWPKVIFYQVLWVHFVGDFECHMTQCIHSIKFSWKKTFDSLLHQYLWTLHSIVRLDMISYHGRGSPQGSITSEISINIIKHVQIIIITIICIFRVSVATKPITFTSTEDSIY